MAWFFAPGAEAGHLIQARIELVLWGDHNGSKQKKGVWSVWLDRNSLALPSLRDLVAGSATSEPPPNTITDD